MTKVPSSSSADQWRGPWRHLRLSTDSPELALGDGVTARIAMSRQALVAKVQMAPGAAQLERRHRGDTFVVVLAGEVRVSTGNGGATESVAADGVAIIPPDRPYSLVAGPDGCTRLDVTVPPDMALAEEAFHEEHANHGFE